MPSQNPNQSSLGSRFGLFGSRIGLVGLICLLALGGLLRLHDLSARAFWQDEAWVVGHISHPPGDLRDPSVTYPQPMLYESALRTAAASVGVTEVTMRLPTAIAGTLLLLVCLPVLARFSSTIWVALLGVLVFTGNPELVHYAREVKHYGVEAFFATAFIWWVTTLPGTSLLRTALTCGMLTLLSIGFGYATVFFLPGIFLIWWHETRKNGQSPLPCFAVGGVTATVFLCDYWIRVRPAVSGGLNAYWQKAFVPWSSPLSIPGWFISTHVDLLNFALPMRWKALAIIPLGLIVSGIFQLWKQTEGRRVVQLMGATWLTLLCVAALHLYPFGNRLVLILVPGLLFLAVAGIDRFVQRLREKGPKSVWWIAFPVLGLVYGPAHSIKERYFQPWGREEIRAPISYLEKNRLPTDTVYIYHAAIPAFRLYYHGTSEGLVYGTPPDPTNGFIPELERITNGKERIWVIFSHSTGKGTERHRILAYLASTATLITEFEDVDASVHLFQNNRTGPPRER